MALETGMKGTKRRTRKRPKTGPRNQKVAAPSPEEIERLAAELKADHLAQMKRVKKQGRTDTEPSKRDDESIPIAFLEGHGIYEEREP